MSEVREYSVTARTTGVFGRVIAAARSHHLVVDGPVQNGALGEAIMPAEMFIAAVASCGAELAEVIARAEGIPLRAATVSAHGLMDPDRPVRPDLTVFNEMTLRFELEGVDDAQARVIVEGFKGR